MRLDYTLKHSLKRCRWRLRRTRGALRWGSAKLQASPVVFGNAMPKSGSHLLTQILAGLTKIGPFVDPGFPPVNRAEDNTNLPSEAVLANLNLLRPGDIRYGYLHAKEPYLSALTQPGIATLFIYRDPRDMLVSHVFYATEMNHDHGMHRYYTEKLHTMADRLDAAIRGITEPGFELASVKDRYQAYLGWLDHPAVLALRFEDLVLDRPAALNRLLDHLAVHGFTPDLPRPAALTVLSEAVAPRRSGTFRSGTPGAWREHFSPANKQAFLQTAGDLLIRLGYEKDNNW